eukprot:COSAG01_NODE_3243_length_6366_cov_53.945588_2_plen_53_part_00
MCVLISFIYNLGSLLLKVPIALAVYVFVYLVRGLFSDFAGYDTYLSRCHSPE